MLLANVLVFLDYGVLGIFLGVLVFHYGCPVHRLNFGKIHTHRGVFVIGTGERQVVLRSWTTVWHVMAGSRAYLEHTSHAPDTDGPFMTHPKR
jgi:hypothetical protein